MTCLARAALMSLLGTLGPVSTRAAVSGCIWTSNIVKCARRAAP
jgi:hypothetical protein